MLFMLVNIYASSLLEGAPRRRVVLSRGSESFMREARIFLGRG
jgi:hypothetical protein